MSAVEEIGLFLVADRAVKESGSVSEGVVEARVVDRGVGAGSVTRTDELDVAACGRVMLNRDMRVGGASGGAARGCNEDWSVFAWRPRLFNTLVTDQMVRHTHTPLAVVGPSGGGGGVRTRMRYKEKDTRWRSRSNFDTD